MRSRTLKFYIQEVSRVLDSQKNSIRNVSFHQHYENLQSEEGPPKGRTGRLHCLRDVRVTLL